MQVKLNVEEDEELRNYIKDLIKGQVISLVRAEIDNVLFNVVERNVNNTMSARHTKLEHFIEEQIMNKINREVSLTEQIQKVIREKIDEKISIVMKDGKA